MAYAGSDQAGGPARVPVTIKILIAGGFGVAPEGVKRELLLLVIARPAPSRHLTAPLVGAAGLQDGRLDRISSLVDDHLGR